MNKLLRIFNNTILLNIAVWSMISLSNCSKSNRETLSLPELTTTAVSSIDNTTAMSGGNISNQGSSAITARGVCWSTSNNPTISDSHTTDGSGTGSFESSITGLTANTSYYVRAYATNATGTAYGNEVSFTTTNTPTIDIVYVSGLFDGSGKVWVDGVATSFGASSTATKVFVKDNDVYVVGSLNTATTTTPVYWKNGTAVQLPATGFTYARDISVDNVDVYAVGYEDVGSGNYIPKVWKNGIASILPVNVSGSANSVAVSGADVYVAGGESDPTGTTASPILWKNGVKQILPTIDGYGGAFSVFISGSDVYVSGFVGRFGTAQPALWKNGVLQILPGDPGIDIAFSVFVSGSDVYVSGMETNYAVMWKNGVATRLTDGMMEAEADNIFVKGNNVYVVGTEMVDVVTRNKVVKLWKNGVESSISDPGQNFVYGLFVK